MIYLVLQDTCVPTLRVYGNWFCVFVQAFDTYGPSPRHKRPEAINTEATFKEYHRRSLDAR